MGVVPAPLFRLPWKMLLLVSGIAGFGLIVLYSAAGGSFTPWAFNQSTKLAVFSTLAFALSRVREQNLARAAFPVYAIVLTMLILVELLGAVSKGSQRWLEFGFLRIQPSELMKPVIVLTVARFYALLPATQLRTVTAIWPAALLIGMPVGLVILQPDLGTAMMICFGGLSVTFLAGLPLRLYIGAALGGAAALPIIYSLLHDYQRNRVMIFLNPEADPLGQGYHITQSKIAIGSGGLFGKGYLQGTQSHLDYLPEGHTDFVFAAMAEEWGLAGGVALILAYLLLIRWGMSVAMAARTRFARLTAAGMAMTIFFYFAINLSMVMGLAPVVGIPLPMFSHGGSAVMTTMICLGILVSIDRENRRGPRPI